MELLKRPASAILLEMLSKDSVLVPIPRSALTTKEMMWPSKEIADVLVANGYGKIVFPCLERTEAIAKSTSGYSAKTRPAVKQQYDTLSVKQEMFTPEKITLIDDVLTMGRTSFACAQRIHEAYPKAHISIFCVVSTQGLIDDMEALFDPSLGTISYNEHTGKTSRNP